MNVPILSVRLDALCCNDLLVMASNKRWLHSGPRCMLGVCPRRCGRAKNKNKNRFGRLSSTPSEDKSTIASKDVRPLALRLAISGTGCRFIAYPASCRDLKAPQNLFLSTPLLSPPFIQSPSRFVSKIASKRLNSISTHLNGPCGCQ